MRRIVPVTLMLNSRSRNFNWWNNWGSNTFFFFNTPLIKKKKKKKKLYVASLFKHPTPQKTITNLTHRKNTLEIDEILFKIVQLCFNSISKKNKNLGRDASLAPDAGTGDADAPGGFSGRGSPALGVRNPAPGCVFSAFLDNFGLLGSFQSGILTLF
jgi:hypothetical protein